MKGKEAKGTFYPQASFALWAVFGGYRRLADNDSGRLRHYGGVGRYVEADGGACADPGAAAYADVPYQHGVCADKAVIPDLWGSAVHLADGDVLVDPAPSADGGVPGDIDTMESVGQRGDVRDVRSPADIAAPLMGHAVEHEG